MDTESFVSFLSTEYIINYLNNHRLLFEFSKWENFHQNRSVQKKNVPSILKTATLKIAECKDLSH